jgi:hypothetical protein
MEEAIANGTAANRLPAFCTEMNRLGELSLIVPRRIWQNQRSRSEEIDKLRKCLTEADETDRNAEPMRS